MAPNGTTCCAKFQCIHGRNRHPDSLGHSPFGASTYTPTTHTDQVPQPLAPIDTTTRAKCLCCYIRNRHPDSPGHMQFGTANTPINQPYSSPSTHARAKWRPRARQLLSSLYKESAPRQSGPPSFRHRPSSPTTRSKHHLSRWRQMAKHALLIFHVAMSGIGTQTIRATCHSAHPPTQTDHSQPLAPNGTTTCAKFLYNYTRNWHPDSPGHMEIGTANTSINHPNSSPCLRQMAKPLAPISDITI